jgi:DNA ligase (NAD+)
MATGKGSMQDLINTLNHYTKLYDEGRPAITDSQWDEMYFQLVEMERSEGVYLPESPTQQINYQVVSELKKIKHNHPMLSLNKTKSIDEMNTFIGNKEFITMLKMDGLTCSLGYKNGRLVSAETRGNGIEGEDILHNIMAVKNVPKRLPQNIDLTVDGEIICTYEDFKQFENEYANPRNFAAGSIRLLSTKESATRNLKFVAWDIINGFEATCDTLNKKLGHLLSLGFDAVPFTIMEKSFNEAIIEDFKEIAKINGYPIDGLVVKYNKVSEYEACGRTDHHFKGGMAFKFADEEYETWLNNIEWTMGRTGVLTPVAIFEPVDTGDSVIERASLHNVSIMKDLLWRPYKGQSLMVCKMNDIIPQVVSAGREVSPADFEGLEFTIPTECPICGGRLEVVCEVDTEVLMCTNDACEGKLVNRLDHFCGKKGLDIRGLSKATLCKLIDWGWVKEPADLYNLNKRLQVWANKPGFGIKSVNNILNAIDNSKNPKLESFICALGIPHVGKTLSAQLAKEFKSYEDFREAATEKWDFTQLDGVAYEKASAIWNFDFTEADHVAEHMLGYEVTGGPSSNTLEGESICITGRLTQHKNRDELVKRITDRGGKVVSGVSKNTTWLINNDVNSTSSKNVTAQRLGIPIITEEEFINQFLSMEI